jgi:hypothetical protein
MRVLAPSFLHHQILFLVGGLRIDIKIIFRKICDARFCFSIHFIYKYDTKKIKIINFIYVIFSYRLGLNKHFGNKYLMYTWAP